MIRFVSLVKENRPRNLPFRAALKKVLGGSYELELIFIDNRFMKFLNTTYRNKRSATNILSFSLSKTSGQIFLSLPFIKKEAKSLRESFRRRLWRLYLHGLLHLKGLNHERSVAEWKKMERAETRLLNFFKI